MPSVTLVPSGYIGLTNLTTNTQNPVSNGYTNADSTSYARFTLGSNSTGYLYYTFDVSSIPSNATISSVTARGKAAVNNTTRVTNTKMQLYSGTTAKGSNTTFAATTASTRDLTPGSWTRNELTNLRLYMGATGSSSGQTKRFDFYGADVTVTYTAETVHVTGVTLDKSTDSVEVGSTTTLTPTVAPSNASDTSVSWSSSNTSVATVNNGVVTGVSTGSATITVTTTDGSFTDTCTVTVTPATYYDYVQTDTLEDGEEYLLANGNTGTVYMLSNVSGGAGALQAVAGTISNGKLSVTGATKAKCLFTCEYETSGDSTSALLKSGTNYLYANSSNGLHMTAWASSMAGRHWHYKAESKHLLWFFNDASGGSDGYEDTSQTYKYYLEEANGNFTAPYVTSPNLANTTTPVLYLFKAAPPAADDKMYVKLNGSWVEATKVYKKVSGSWVEQSDLTQVFDSGTNYKYST